LNNRLYAVRKGGEGRDGALAGAPEVIRLVLADPFMVFRLGVRAILSEATEFDVTEVGSIGELEELLEQSPPPDLALVDLDLPASGAEEAVVLLRRQGVAPIVWSTRARLSPELVFSLVQAGAIGVLTKEISATGLVRALRGSTHGQAALGRETGRLLIDGTQAAGAGTTASGRIGSLSRRELEVLELVAEGYTNKEIAAQLCLSEFTVKRHMQNILRKTDVDSRSEAAAFLTASRRDGATSREGGGSRRPVLPPPLPREFSIRVEE
jgi:DNA-binding NarL/FixJ family response regulator